MYIVTRRYETASPQFPEAGIRQIKEGLVPLLRQVQGFVSYDAFQAGDGVVASVSMFETRSGAEESARQAAEWVKQNLAAMLPKAPQVTAGEVLVHESRQPAGVR
jgi:hypothetical protein